MNDSFSTELYWLNIYFEHFYYKMYKKHLTTIRSRSQTITDWSLSCRLGSGVRVFGFGFGDVFGDVFEPNTHERAPEPPYWDFRRGSVRARRCTKFGRFLCGCCDWIGARVRRTLVLLLIYLAYITRIHLDLFLFPGLFKFIYL